jgi:hypothetical protein
MKPIVLNVYILMMFLAYVMRRAGTFSMEEKVKMIEFIGYMALNPNNANLPILSVLKFSAVKRDASATVVTTPVAATAYTGSSIC